MNLKFNRHAELTEAEYTALVNAPEGRDDFLFEGARFLITINHWSKGSANRLYVTIRESGKREVRAFLDLNDSADMTLNFDFDALTMNLYSAFAAWVATLIPAVEAIEEVTEVIPPTMEQVIRMNAALGGTSDPSAFDANEDRLDSARGMWHVARSWNFLNGPFDQQPTGSELLEEWNEIVRGVQSGLIDWDDLIVSFENHKPLRAVAS